MNTTPGVAVTDTITITNVGNVPENNIALTDTLHLGPDAHRPRPGLACGRPVHDRNDHPHARRLDAAEQHPRRDPHRDVRPVRLAADPDRCRSRCNVAVPGAAAIASASVAASQLGNSNLAARLSDLSTR